MHDDPAHGAASLAPLPAESGAPSARRLIGGGVDSPWTVAVIALLVTSGIIAMMLVVLRPSDRGRNEGRAEREGDRGVAGLRRAASRRRSR